MSRGLLRDALDLHGESDRERELREHLAGCKRCGAWGVDGEGRLMCCCSPEQYRACHPETTNE